MQNSFVRRATTGAAGLALAAGTLAVGIAPAAQAVTTRTGEATAGASWLASQVPTGGLIAGAYGPDAGLSIDTALALDALGAQAATVATIGSGIASAASYGSQSTYTDTWTDPDHSATITSTASNALAKKVVGLQVARPGEATLGALVTDLEGVTQDSGRISDGATRDGVPDPASDYANTFGQAFAARALIEADSPEATTVLGYLLSQQCTAGWFPEGIAAVDATDARCDATAGAEPSIGATATAVLQLVALADDAGAQQAAVTEAIADGATWLATQQAADGGFGTGATFGANANDTGLAGWALGEAGEDAAAGRAATWLASRQVVSVAGCGVAPYAGAITYDDAAFADGIDSLTLGQTVRATAQGLAALRYLPADAVTRPVPGTTAISAPTGFVAAGSKVSVKVSGVRAGQQACVLGGQRTVQFAGSGTVTVLLPAGTATRTLTFRSEGRAVTAKVKVLAATKLSVKAASKVKRGKKLTVTVRKAAPGERITVKLGTKKLGTATASKAGVAEVTGKVARSTKAKRTAISVTGQFANRTGSTKVKVTR